MRNNFKDYARTFCQLCAPFSIQISINQERKQKYFVNTLLGQHVNNDVSSELPTISK